MANSLKQKVVPQVPGEFFDGSNENHAGPAQAQQLPERIVEKICGNVTDVIDLENGRAVIVYEADAAEACVFTDEPTTLRAMIEDDHTIPFLPGQEGLLVSYCQSL